MLGRDKLDKLVESAETIISDETPDDAQIGVAMLVVEVRDIIGGGTAFYTFCSDKREWIQRALLNEATVAVDMSEIEVDGGE